MPSYGALQTKLCVGWPQIASPTKNDEDTPTLLLPSRGGWVIVVAPCRLPKVCLRGQKTLWGYPVNIVDGILEDIVKDVYRL